MKKNINFLFVLFLTHILNLSMIHAKNYNIDDYEHKVVKKRISFFDQRPEPIFKKIEQIIQEFYNGSYGTELCKATSSYTSMGIEYSTGVSSEIAEVIFNKCQQQNKVVIKTFPKSYYIIKDAKKTLPIESWTDRSNNTFLIIDEETTYEKLKELIAHELAFTLDSKFKMTLSGYNNLNPSNNTTHTEQQKIMRSIMLAGRNDYIAYLFGLIRAYQVEDLILGKPLKVVVKNHDDCATNTINYFNKYQNVFGGEYFSNIEHPLAVTMASDAVVGQFILDKNSLADLKSDLNTVLDPRAYFVNSKNEQVSFCQYMTEPLITAGPHYNIKAIGPRPRVGGGSEDGGSSDSEHNNDKVINDF